MKRTHYLATVLFTLCAAQTQAEDLLTIYQQALDADPQLKSAQTKVDIGAAQKGQALGQMLPQITGTGNWSHNEQTVSATQRDIETQYPGTRYYVSLNQSLIDFAKFWEWRRASKAEDQYAAEAIEAQNELINNVVERYFDWSLADDEVILVRKEKDAMQKQLEQVRKQFAKQMLKITDVYAVEARLDQLVAEQIMAETKRVTAEAALRELTGNQPDKPMKLREEVEYQTIQGDLQQWLDMAQSQNPLISSKIIAIEVAENNVAVQKSKHLPVVDLQLNYFDTDTGYQSSRTFPTQTQVAAINVNVPIFNGGTTTHQMFEAQHRLQMSKYDNEATLRGLIKETSDAFLSSNASVRHIEAAQKALESAAKSRESMEKGLHYGVVTVSDLLKAQQDEFRTRRDLAEARYIYIKHRMRFLRAIGSINEDNVREVNAWLAPLTQTSEVVP